MSAASSASRCRCSAGSSARAPCDLGLDLAHVELGDQARVGALALQLERARAEVERPLGRGDLLVQRPQRVVRLHHVGRQRDPHRVARALGRQEVGPRGRVGVADPAPEVELVGHVERRPVVRPVHRNAGEERDRSARKRGCGSRRRCRRSTARAATRRPRRARAPRRPAPRRARCPGCWRAPPRRACRAWGRRTPSTTGRTARRATRLRGRAAPGVRQLVRRPLVRRRERARGEERGGERRGPGGEPTHGRLPSARRDDAAGCARSAARPRARAAPRAGCPRSSAARGSGGR